MMQHNREIRKRRLECLMEGGEKSAKEENGGQEVSLPRREVLGFLSSAADSDPFPGKVLG